MENNAPRILIISHDVVGTKMAGPGIRFFEFAKLLSRFAEVTLAVPNRADIKVEGFRIRQYSTASHRTLKSLTEKADVMLIQGHIIYYFPFLKNFKGKIIVDLYNPFNLESLEMFADRDIAERIRIDKNNLNILKLQLAIGDYFICASEKQRDYWLGMLVAMGRINPYSYDDDNTLRKLIDVVPFGIPSQPPQHTGESTLKDIVPNLREDDKVALWGGGIWNWLDPITAIKAIWEITRHRKDIKLVFLGIRHPDPKLPEMNKCVEAIKLSKELELFNQFVFFNEWVPYQSRQNFLLGSDVGLSIHQKRIETEYSYRTRVIDYIWARLPVITTQGDSIAKLVKEYNIGEVVRYENAQHLARVMESMLTNNSLKEIYKKNMNKLAPIFSWENVAKPLIEYCMEADYAHDKKQIMDLIDMQNSKISRVINNNFGGSTNILAITSNKYEDRELLAGGELGKIHYLEIGEIEEEEKARDSDLIGSLKSKISARTRFDGIIVNNAFSDISPKFFYDLVNVLGGKLKSEGLLFISIPEERGLASYFEKSVKRDRVKNRIDDFMVTYILKHADFQIIDSGNWDKVEKNEKHTPDDIGQLYGKNELFELFQIKMSREGFRDLKLLSRFDMLKSDALADDSTIKGKLKRYMYTLTSLYFENLRKSFNQSTQSLNHNLHLQINREINELNKKNRERMLLIYFNIFKALSNEINKLGSDMNSIREFLAAGSPQLKKEEEFSLDERLEALLTDFENIDRIMGLTVSSRYYLARKL
ncbi:MAG: glycosyltransferase [Actinomycetota bacterium]